MDVFSVVTFLVTATICYWRVGCGRIESQLRGAAMIARSPMEYAVYGEERLLEMYRSEMSWFRTWSTIVAMGAFWVCMTSNVAASFAEYPTVVDLLLATISIPMVLIAVLYLPWACHRDYKNLQGALREDAAMVMPTSHPERLL